MPEEIKYPITQDDCPNCHSKERLGQRAIKELQEEGKLSKGLYPDGLMMQIPLIDSKRITALFSPTVKVPIIIVYWDVCKECRTMYCTKFDLQVQDVPVELKNMPKQGPPKFSPS